MRSIRLLTTLGVLLLTPDADLPAQARSSRWAVGFHVSRDAFRGGSSDTSAAGNGAEVLPAPRISYEVNFGRRLGRTELDLGLSYAGGGTRAATSSLLFEDHTSHMTRLRARLLLAHALAGSGPIQLLIAGGPSVEQWLLTDFSDHVTLSGHLGLVLRAGRGRLSYENRFFFGLGGSPFAAIDVPAPGRRETLKTWSLGAGLRYRL